VTVWSHVKVLAPLGAAADCLDDFSANLSAPILIAGGRGHQVIDGPFPKEE
jgi:hypothetical protein